MSKQLLPVYDKPMIYYPLRTLMLAGIRDILLISTPQDTPRFQQLLGDGASGAEPPMLYSPPDGLAQAFLIGREFLGNRPRALILGDNVFYGHDFANLLRQRRSRPRRHRLRLSGKRPRALWRGGVRRQGRAISIEEKPAAAQNQFRRARPVFLRQPGGGDRRRSSPSPRGELEITDVNQEYLRRGR